jgi:hypothetical protein
MKEKSRFFDPNRGGEFCSNDFWEWLDVIGILEDLSWQLLSPDEWEGQRG